MGKQARLEVDTSRWVQCALCGIEFNWERTRHRVDDMKICVWCTSRRATMVTPYIRFVRSFANDPCEAPLETELLGGLDMQSEDCGECDSCLARKIVANHKSMLDGSKR